jgi:hypothetical protein
MPPISRERLKTLLFVVLISVNAVVARESRALGHFQWSTRVFTFLVFSLTLIVLRGGPARILGIVFVASIVTAVAVRLWARERPDTAPTTTI